MSHAERMDGVYRFQRHIYDLTRKYYLLGRDRVLGDLKIAPGEVLIEIGCGTARNLIQAARLNPQARLLGIDASEAMLVTARAKIAAAGLSGQIKVAFAFAETVDPQSLFALERPVDHVLFSYSLSMIPDWQGALEHAVTLIRPGGSLHVVDFGDQRGLPGWFKGGLEAWLEKFHVTIRKDLPAVLTALAGRIGGQVIERPLYRGYALAAELRTPSTAARGGEV